MKQNQRPRFRQAAITLGLVIAGAAGPLSTRAATTTVSVGDNFFSPASVTIHANDTVQWNWTGVGTHSSTGSGTPPLWDSGLHGNGFTFSHTFSSAGTFSYICTLHAAIGMIGSVTVQAVNTPPSVALTAPANGAHFAAPWTGTLKVSDSDPDDTVTRVDFFAGTNLLGSVQNPSATASLRVTNFAAGTYTLTAKATDSRGASTTSAGVTIHVLTPAAILISSPARLSPTSFEFSYTATPGLSYVVQRSAGFPFFAALGTNTAAASPVSFTDTNAVGPVNYYRVELLPNP